MDACSRVWTGLGLTAVALTSVACSSAPEPYMGSPTRGQMIAHFDLAVELRDHAVQGELQSFRATAQALADLDPARELPPDIVLQLGPMRWEAQAGASARTNGAAARAAAEIARTCGECHAANDVSLDSRFTGGVPAAASDIPRHMAGLARITELLWEGLVGPSDRSWAAGADALLEAGALPDEMLEELPERDVRFASDRLQRLAREAAAATESDYRVRALAEIWATCSECHAIAR